MSQRRNEDKYHLSLQALDEGLSDALAYSGCAVKLLVWTLVPVGLAAYYFRIPAGYVVAAVYVFFNAFSFWAIRTDKIYAQNDQRRFSEATLHIFEAAGGFAGSFLAQQLYHHKTQKVSYQITYWVIVGIHVGLWILWFKLVVPWLGT